MASLHNPLVSVILPLYNGRAYLPTALNSIARQHYPHLEIVAVDDGSTDGGSAILENFAATFAGKLQMLCHPGRRRRGIAASYRLALPYCRGGIIAFLDQDDYWSDHKISAQVQVLQQVPEAGVVFSDVHTFSDGGTPAATPFEGFLNRPPREKPFDAFSRLLWGNFVLTFSNIMVRREHLRPSDFLSKPDGYQDWMLLLLLSARCRFYHCRQVQTFWRQHAASFHGALKQHGNYAARNRTLRRAVLDNALERILAERARDLRNANMSPAFWPHRYWKGIVAMLDAAHQLVDFCQHPLRRRPQRVKDKGLRIKDKGVRSKDKGVRSKDKGVRSKDKGVNIPG